MTLTSSGGPVPRTDASKTARAHFPLGAAGATRPRTGARRCPLSAVVGVLMGLLLLGAAFASPAAARDVFNLNGDVYVQPNEVVETAGTLNGDVVVEGWVQETAFTANGDIRVLSGGRIDGEAVSLSGRVVIEEGGTVTGEIVEFGNARATVSGGDGTVPVPPLDPIDSRDPFGWFFFTLGSLGLGLVLVLIAAPSLRAVGQEAIARPGRSALVAFALSVGLPIVWIILLISVVGIPVALLMIPAIPLVAMFGTFSLALLAGERLLEAAGKDGAAAAWAMLAGVGVFAVIGLVPVLGPLALLVASFVGMGAAFSRIWDAYQDRRSAKAAGRPSPPLEPPTSPTPAAPLAPPTPAPSAPAAIAPEPSGAGPAPLAGLEQPATPGEPGPTPSASEPTPPVQAPGEGSDRQSDSSEGPRFHI